ncbi:MULTISPECIES: HAMP domain-containing protein [Oscillatoriales]|uniref:HAMP domain-containing protein n=2 Tax=Limnospira TaxID=2596745 RepID=A0ABU9EL30_LIMFS|nr:MULTISPECIES: HAMP domain-containing protein [Oscillatoriales]AMW30384.1 histidine kinase [Arthrospira platensis YZ]KDR55971.1 histidine kinase [Arthrospira platensis str. Paraca]MBD2668111.1 HAMP domain-containing protein [Arthrospira platensis FACHB-439]MBD2709178.1 HAMP domain-containing protein [Arthrospira platensis FACHB-835]MDC0839042.1 HAMP domain-containing protein [Limnoraphis robusta]MDT9309184.1 HAMP domain-containing protein [Limnospira sp. Paracas R14]MDY7054076.1 HAMP domai
MINNLRVFVSGEEFGRQDLPRGGHSEGIDRGLQRENGRGSYLNYAGVPVLGVFRCLEHQELVLLVEMPRSEALDPARQLAWTTLGVGLTFTGLLTVGVYLLASQISRPILAIATVATKVADGDLTPVAPVMTDDQVGTLAMAFNPMTGQLRRLYAGLQEKVTLLQQTEVELNQSLEQLQIEKQAVEYHQAQISIANQEITLLNDRLKNENIDLAQELKVSNKLLRQFLEAMPLAVVVVDHLGQLYYTNQAAHILF